MSTEQNNRKVGVQTNTNGSHHSSPGRDADQSGRDMDKRTSSVSFTNHHSPSNSSEKKASPNSVSLTCGTIPLLVLTGAAAAGLAYALSGDSKK